MHDIRPAHMVRKPTQELDRNRPKGDPPAIADVVARREAHRIAVDFHSVGHLRSVAVRRQDGHVHRARGSQPVAHRHRGKHGSAIDDSREIGWRDVQNAGSVPFDLSHGVPTLSPLGATRVAAPRHSAWTRSAICRFETLAGAA